MSLYSEYLEQAIPTPFTVLGVKLRPYSLGHKLVLGRINSPFEVGGEIDVSDIVTAVLVFGHDYGTAVEMLDDPDIASKCAKWAVNLQTAGRWPFRKLVPIEWPAKIALLRQYIEAHSKMPIYSFDDKQLTECNCPLPQMVKVELMAKMHLSECDVLNRPWGLCLWDYITLRVISGMANMVDVERERELIRQAREGAE